MTDFGITQIFLVVFAGIGVGLTIFEAYMRWFELKPRVKVTLYEFNVPALSELSKVTSEKQFYDMYARQPTYVFIRAENVGNKPVTLLSPKIRMPGTMSYAPDLTSGSSKWESDVNFPHELMPANSCSVRAPLEEVKRYLKTGGYKGKTTIRAAYVGAVGNEYYSKQTWSDRLRRVRKEERELTLMLDTESEPDTAEPSEPDKAEPSRLQRLKIFFCARKKED